MHLDRQGFRVSALHALSIERRTARARVSVNFGNFRGEDRAASAAGPAGLYFAISMKLRDPAHEIDVFERNRPGVTFGWGVVFSDLTVDNIKRNDPVSARRSSPTNSRIGTTSTSTSAEQTITSGGHGFIGIGRKRLLEILQDRARELGVALHFEAECDPADPEVARL